MWRCLRDWIGGKSVVFPPENASESYEEMLKNVKSLRETLVERGVDIEKIRKDLPEYLEKLEVVGSSAIAHGSEVPVSGSVHVALNRCAKSSDMNRQLRK